MYHRSIAPDDIFFAVWTKADITTNKAGTLVSMEARASASYKLTKNRSELHPITIFKSEIQKLLGNNFPAPKS